MAVKVWPPPEHFWSPIKHHLSNSPNKTDSIFRVDRGRMRNLWYPKHKAEYMTAQRFAELGLSKKHDVGEREYDFRAHEAGGGAAEDETVAAPAPRTAAEEAVASYTLAVRFRFLSLGPPSSFRN